MFVSLERCVLLQILLLSEKNTVFVFFSSQMDILQTTQSGRTDTRNITALQYHNTTPCKNTVVTDHPFFAEAVSHLDLFSVFSTNSLPSMLAFNKQVNTGHTSLLAPATGRRQGQIVPGGIGPKTEASVCKSFQWN